MRTTRGLKLQASLRKCYWGSSLFFEGKTLVSDDALRISNDGADALEIEAVLCCAT